MIDPDPTEVDLDKLNFLVVIRKEMNTGGASPARGIIMDKIDELIIKELNPIQPAKTEDDDIPF